MNEHSENAELLDVMTGLYNNISYNLAILEHSDWDSSTTVFDLSHRNKFIERLLYFYDLVPRNCGVCMYFKLGDISSVVFKVTQFYGIDLEDRFGQAVQHQLNAAMESYADDLKRLLNAEYLKTLGR